MKKYILFWLILSCSYLAAQTSYTPGDADQEAIHTLNDCAQYANECIHGMLIVHRLLENFNQKLNKYVDKEGQPLNFYSNDDLPKDLFEDPDKWFYSTTPHEWKKKCVNGIQLHLNDSKGQAILHEIKVLHSITQNTNTLRFDLEKLMVKISRDRSYLPNVYTKLEEGVKLYNQFYVVRNRLSEKLNDYYQTLSYQRDPQLEELYATLSTIHETCIRGARHYRFDNVASMPSIQDQLRAQQSTLHDQAQSILANQPGTARQDISKRIQNIEGQLVEYLKQNSTFINGPTTPAKYSQYGDLYYYHNTQILSQINRYGNGIVHEMNSLFGVLNAGFLYFIEEPHLFKVIYPEESVEEKEEVVATEVIEKVPDTIDARQLVKRKQAIALTDEYVDIEIYDHQKLDRDIVSLNYNGEWILRKFTITDKPKRLRLKLNDTGVNFLVLHADNVGVIPPNTMALSYRINGQKQEIILNSDLNTSEVIELVR